MLNYKSCNPESGLTFKEPVAFQEIILNSLESQPDIIIITY